MTDLCTENLVYNVPITSEMMQYMREARSKYSEALEKEKKEAAKRARTILAISRRFLAYFGLFWTI